MYQSNTSIQVTNQSEKRAGRCGWIVILLIFIACLSALGHPPRKVVADAFSWSGPDFTYCYLFLRGWWDGALTNPYDYDQQRALLEQVYNYRGSVIMPAAWTPLSTLTLYPFLQSPDPANAVEVWNLATLAVFVGALLLWLREAISTRQELWSRALVGVMLLQSLPSAQTLEVGQTAFLGAGLLAIVVLLASHQWRLRDIAIAACLIGMAIKPTYLLVALSILAVQRQWRAMIISVAIIAIVGLASALILPIAAWPDWWHQLQFHANPVDVRYLSPGTVEGHIQSAVLRNVLTMAFSDELAHRVASLIFAVLTIGALLVGTLRARSQSPTGSFLVLSVFLVAIPYLGFHDELLLFPLLVSRWPSTVRPDAVRQILLLATICMFCCVPLSPILRVVLKLLIILQLYRIDLPPSTTFAGMRWMRRLDLASGEGRS